jgi:SAM-dependent methyltransferase
MKSSSSLGTVPFYDKIREGIGLASMHLRGRNGVDFGSLDRCLNEYDATLSHYGRSPLRRSTVLEIGFGARPHRLAWLYNSGIQVSGVDLDKPLLHASPSSFLEVMQQNGAERAIKSLVRYCMVDVHQWRQMAAEVARRGQDFRVPEERLTVADAASPSFWAKAGSFDFVYSEDVFEHIPKSELNVLVEKMANALRPKGLALIRPMVFTGICGGHHLEWFPHTLSNKNVNRRTEPWEHLRRGRFPANTYLNRLTRKDYVVLFARHFLILEERVMKPNLGMQFMTHQVRNELAEYDDYELFSNSVGFVLEPKRA